MFCKYCGYEEHGEECKNAGCPGHVKDNDSYCELCGKRLPVLKTPRIRNGKPEVMHTHKNTCNICNPMGSKLRAHQLCKNNPEKINVIYVCACKDRKKLHHHFNYTRPYDVVDLCRQCHAAEHARLRLLAAQSAITPPTTDSRKAVNL